MKVGFRKPTFKKSLTARTTAKWKRQTKKLRFIALALLSYLVLIYYRIT